MNEESQLQLDRYLQVANRRKWVVIVPALLAVLAAVAISYFSSPVYAASATTRIDLSSQSTTTQDTGPADRYIATYAEIVRANGFLDRVIKDLNLQNVTNLDLKKRVTTARVADTELVKVTATASTAAEAKAIADDLAKLLSDPVFVSQFIPNADSVLTPAITAAQSTLDDEQARLATLKANGASQTQIDSQQEVVDAADTTFASLLKQRSDALVQQGTAARSIVVIESASLPDSPTSPKWKFNIAAGLLAGLFAGIALGLVLEYVDPTLRGVGDLAGVTRLPVLASIPFGIRWTYPPPPVSPDYRLLATKLQTALQEGNHKSVLFTSSRPEEGCTTVATYSAMALAQAGLRVLLLDANLNRPDLHRLFNLPLAPGLYDFVSSTNGSRPKALTAGDESHSSPVPRLNVLTAGAKMNDPSELLASAEMRGFLDHLETEWDAIIIDGSAMQSSAGSAVMAPVVDGVVFVAAEGQASSKSVEDTVKELTSLGAHGIGLVYCKATE
jgi:capsular exopolysaccharide synthesis family protein